MSEQTPQDRGREFELEVAEIVGAKQVKGSGNGIYKLDVGGNTLLYSCKHTDNKGIRVDSDLMQEMRDATSGAGGVGADVTPLLVVRFGVSELVSIMSFTDQVTLLRAGGELIPPSKDLARRAAASKPSILR